jgi:hypothetical protein
MTSINVKKMSRNLVPQSDILEIGKHAQFLQTMADQIYLFIAKEPIESGR